MEVKIRQIMPCNEELYVAEESIDDYTVNVFKVRMWALLDLDDIGGAICPVTIQYNEMYPIEQKDNLGIFKNKEEFKEFFKEFKKKKIKKEKIKYKSNWIG